MKVALIVVAVLTLVIGGGVALAMSSSKELRGSIEYTLPDMPELTQKVSIDIGPIGLKPLKWIARVADEPEVKLLGKIDSVKVRVYDVDGDYINIANRLKMPLAALKNQGWEQTLSVNENNERVMIYTQAVENAFTGVIVLVVNAREAVFINAAGKLAQDDLAQVVQLHHAL